MGGWNQRHIFTYLLSLTCPPLHYKVTSLHFFMNPVTKATYLLTKSDRFFFFLMPTLVDVGCLEVFAKKSNSRLKERVLSSISSLCRERLEKVGGPGRTVGIICI